MSLQSLESERQAILHRMQMSRESYRHMLAGDEEPVHTHAVLETQEGTPIASSYHPAYVRTYPSDGFPRSMTMKLITRHPVALAVAVAALVVVGPRRLLRTAVTSGTALSALTLRNQANAAMVGRLIRLAGQYMQQRNQRGRWSR